MLSKLKNWLLPIIFGLLGSVEMFFGLFSDLVKEAQLPSYYTTVFRIVALLITVIITKNQPPSLKRVRRAKEIKKRLDQVKHRHDEKPI